MPLWQWIVFGFAAAAVIWLVLITTLMVFGRREEALAIARFIPDCIVLFRRLLGDGRVPRRRKLLVFVALGYLALPIDLIPDFVPVAGQLDDAIVVALVLRSLLRSAGRDVLREYWPGPPSTLDMLERLAYGSGARTERS